MNFKPSKKNWKMFYITRTNLFYKNYMSLHRCICTGQSCLISEKAFQKIKLKQAKMQCDNDLPVYLKCGSRDKLLYYISWALVTFGTVQSIKGMRKLLKQYG